MPQTSTVPITVPTMRYQMVQTLSTGARTVLAEFETEDVALRVADMLWLESSWTLEVRATPEIARKDAEIRQLIRRDFTVPDEVMGL